MSNDQLRLRMWPKGIDFTATGLAGIGAAVLAVIVVYVIHSTNVCLPYVF